MAVMVDEELVGESSSNSSSHSKRRNVAAHHYLAKCVLHGSAVLHAVHGHLRSPHSIDIVFAKETSLELVIVGEDGVIQSIFEQSVFGTIKDLAILPWSDKYSELGPEREGKDLLVVLSDSGKLSFLNFCSEMHRFFSLTHIELSKPGNLIRQLGRMLAVDPGGSFIAVSAYEDCFAVFPISLSADRNIVYEKILYPSESNGDMGITKETTRTSALGIIWSICFISTNSQQRGDSNPILAIIVHRKGSILNDLMLFSCNPKMHAIHAIAQYSEAGPLAINIAAIPHLPGYALLSRVGDLLLLDLREPNNIVCLHKINLNVPSVEEHSYVEEVCKGLDADDEGMFNVAASALLELRDSGVDVVKGYDPMTIDNASDAGSKVICSWTWEIGNSTSSRLIFCLDTGEIYVADVHMEHHGIQINLSDCVYKGLGCKALLWIKGGLVAGLVEMGDGFVLRWEDNRLTYKSSIQNIAPIMDLSIVDYHDGKQDQMFACCGMGLEGSLRIIRSGISVENLLKTAPIYQGVSGTWTMKMKQSANFHSFLVLSFIEETRVLSVGLSFSDVTEAVGFLPDVCTIACGLVADSLLVQIHKTGIRLCLPTALAHLEGVPLSEPICSSWSPNNVTISVGAVGRGLITVATSNPCFLSVLGVRLLSPYHCEVYEMQQVRLQHEVSCISIPIKNVDKELSSEVKTNSDHEASLDEKINTNTAFVIGTHRPSIEVLLFDHQGTVKVLAIGLITINNALGGPISGCIPEDVKLVSIDHPYILAGLRNGMLLRFEWPEASVLLSQLKQYISSHFAMIQNRPNSSSSVTFSSANEMDKTKHSSPVSLELIAIRRIGITPVVLVPMQDSLDADIIVLSDRTWLLHTARHSLAYTSISFQPATHVTPVCSVDCPKGILFVADNSLNLVEMVHCKRLNVQKFSLGGTPRKVIFHAESKTLLVMRIGLGDESCSSDICRVDPASGSLCSMFKCQPGETAKCMQVVNVGKEQVLIVGTSQSSGRTIMPSGEAESTRGRLLVLSLDGLHIYTGGSSHNYYPSMNMSSHIGSPFGDGDLVDCTASSSPDDSCSEGLQLDEAGAGQLQLVCQYVLSAAVLSVCSYLDRYVLAAAGNTLNVFGFLNENPQRLKRLTAGRTRFTITCLKTNFSRIAVGDCRDGILFYSYHEDLRKLEQLYSDPAQRLVADCALVDGDTAVVSDRRGSISVLSCPIKIDDPLACEGPEKNLMLNCSFYMGETVMSIQKASISCKLPVDDVQNGSDAAEVVQEYAYDSVIASTLLGSVFVLIPVTSEEQVLLEAVQARLALHPLTCPILGNDHKEYRARGQPAGVSTILDGDMLAQFLELTSLQQESVLSSFGLNARASALERPLSVNQVVGLLERVHYALN